jgi:hypothetical protein
MKNQFFILLGLVSLSLIFSNCSEQKSAEEIKEVKEVITLNLNSIDDDHVIRTEKQIVSSSDDIMQIADDRGNPNTRVTGNYVAISGNRYQFTAMENSSGVRGEIMAFRTNGAHVRLKTICVYTEDNEAVYAGLVTKVFEPGFLGLNYIAFFKSADNGEGANAASDQTGALLYFYPDWFDYYDSVDDFLVDINCQNFGLGFGGLIDIESGQIQID